MSRSEVEAAFGRTPECETRLGSGRVLLFLDPAHRMTEPPCPSLAPSYDVGEDLPWIYSSVQVVLSPAGQVTAFVHVGESAVTAQGLVRPAATLRELSRDILEGVARGRAGPGASRLEGPPNKALKLTRAAMALASAALAA